MRKIEINPVVSKQKYEKIKLYISQRMYLVIYDNILMLDVFLYFFFVKPSSGQWWQNFFYPNCITTFWNGMLNDNRMLRNVSFFFSFKNDFWMMYYNITLKCSMFVCVCVYIYIYIYIYIYKYVMFKKNWYNFIV